MIRRRVPRILTVIEKLRHTAQSELWRRERYCTGRSRDRKIEAAKSNLKNIDEIESWCREHLSNEQLEEMVQ